MILNYLALEILHSVALKHFYYLWYNHTAPLSLIGSQTKPVVQTECTVL